MVATPGPGSGRAGGILIGSAPQLLERLRASDFFQWADARFDVIDRAKQAVSGNAAVAAAPMFAFVQDVFRASSESSP